MRVVITDGGRAEAGFRGTTGDCVTRAIAIATGLPYRQVYDDLNDLTRMKRARGKGEGARTGVSRKIYEPYLYALGFSWTPTMQIGQGCRVHLRAGELPGGAVVAAVSRHLVAVIDGVIHDLDDPSRGGTRCVYGYYRRLDPGEPEWDDVDENADFAREIL